MKIFFFIAAFLVFAANAYALCTEPYDSMIINEDTLLCEGEFELPNGIVIASENAVLDCGGAVISGELIGNGIKIDSSGGAVVKNCVIMDYENGILSIDSDNVAITENRLLWNLVGIKLINSFGAEIHSNHDESIDSPVEFIEYEPIRELPVERPVESDHRLEEALVLYTDGKKKEAAEHAAVHDLPEILKHIFEYGFADLGSEISEEQQEAVLSELGISEEDYIKSLEKADVSRIVYIEGERALYNITVTAKDNIAVISVHEYFPESLENLEIPEDAEIGDNHFTVEKRGVEANARFSFGYSADSSSLGREQPLTILNVADALEAIGITTEEKPLWYNVLYYIGVFLIIYLISFIGVQFREYKKFSR